VNVRAQISMVFHLEKCVGCHTCSLTCKTMQTDRRGAEYMWWNNVEMRDGGGIRRQSRDGMIMGAPVFD
jgi:nitrate reductase beta subunit